MKLEELKVYQVAMEIGEEIYEKAIKWDYFDKKTIGGQVIRAADSIAANISEGYGRYYFRETKLFLYYARGSAHEMKTWIIKANKRDLINPHEFESMITKTDFLIALINGFIKSIGNSP